MGTYVVSDIHGCYDKLQKLLEIISFSNDDLLILAGDYVDRGKQNIEILRWLARKPKNVIAIKGNHDIDFCLYIGVMEQAQSDYNLSIDESYPGDAEKLYYFTKYALEKTNPLGCIYFDYYETVERLVKSGKSNFNEMKKWKNMIEDYPFFVKKEINNVPHIIVHAGYTEEFYSNSESIKSVEEFYIYAREEALLGGIVDGVIVAGHTPTVMEDTVFYTGGDVFKKYDKEKNCTFYNIDCGCAYEGYKKGSKLAAIRLEDKRCFYI